MGGPLCGVTKPILLVTEPCSVSPGLQLNPLPTTHQMQQSEQDMQPLLRLSLLVCVLEHIPKGDVGVWQNTHIKP